MVPLLGLGGQPGRVRGPAAHTQPACLHPEQALKAEQALSAWPSLQLPGVVPGLPGAGGCGCVARGLTEGMASGTATTSSCGACSNSASSTLAPIFFTPSPDPLPPALRGATSRVLPVGARGALLLLGAAADGGGAVGAAAAAAAPLLAAAAGGGGAGAAAVVGLGAAMLPHRSAEPGCCGERAEGEPGAASAASLAASFSSCLRYSCAERDVYFASILSDPISSQPCCLKKVRARWLPPTAMSRSWSSDQVSSVVDLWRGDRTQA